MSACKVCLSPLLEEIEAHGREALEGTISWRRAAANGEVTPQSLKNHMDNHVIAPAVAEAQAAQRDEMDLLIEEAKQGLLEQFYFAPPDVKPLILVAIQNLEGLRFTKPSQEALIRALKTVQEMTGMKNEQRLLLGFADAMFRQKPLKVANEAAALEPGGDPS